MSQVKLSVSLSQSLKPRSAAIQQAIRLLGEHELQSAHEEAWDEWESSGDSDLWESATADGLADASR